MSAVVSGYLDLYHGAVFITARFTLDAVYDVEGIVIVGYLFMMLTYAKCII